MHLRELKEQASQAVAKGRFDRAEMLYRQALMVVPRDAQLWLKHAEAMRQLDLPGEAVESYRMSATIFATDGHYPRAIAAMKLALEIMPDDVDLISNVIRLELRVTQARERTHGQVSSPPPAPGKEVPSLPQLPAHSEVAPEWPQVRRLSDSEVAMKATAESKWVVVSSVTPLVVRYASEIEQAPVQPR